MASISPRTRSRHERGPRMSEFDKQVNELLRQAMEQPGVAETLRVYQTQQPAMDAFAAAQSAISPRWVVSASSSTRASPK